MRVSEIRTDGTNFLLCVRHEQYPKVPHEPDVVEVLCADSIGKIIRELEITATVSVRVIPLDPDDGTAFCLLIETSSKPPLETIRLLEARINKLPPVIL